MAVAARLDRAMLGHTRFLAQARQRIIFTHEGDHRTALAPFADHGGGNAGDILGDAKSLMAQFGEMFGRRARLGVAHLRHRPDPVAQIDETRLDRVNAKPDVAAVVHIAVLRVESGSEIVTSFAEPRLASAG